MMWCVQIPSCLRIELTDQVITLAVRTPLTKAKKGALKDTPLEDLLISLLTVRPYIPSIYILGYVY